MPPPMLLPITKMSGSSPHAAVAPPGPAEKVCVSSIISSAPYRVASSRSPARKPGSGSTMPMLVSAGSVRIAATSPCASSLSTAGEVVQLRDPGRQVERHRGRDVAGRRRASPSGPGTRERLVDRPVVAVGEDQDLRPPGDQPGQPDRPAVRVGRGQREGPQRQPEAAGQLGADPLGVGGRQHRRDAAELAHPPRHRLDRRRAGCGRPSRRCRRARSRRTRGRRRR